MSARGRDGELLELEPSVFDLHACDRGWLGDDLAGKPIACPDCKPHRMRTGKPVPAPVVRGEVPIRRERREDVPAKAARLLTTGSVTLQLVTPDRVRARVRGDSGRYEVRRDERGWRCTCPARAMFRARCSHVAAVCLVVGARP